jgi:hypothetical protein
LKALLILLLLLLLSRPLALPSLVDRSSGGGKADCSSSSPELASAAIKFFTSPPPFRLCSTALPPESESSESSLSEATGAYSQQGVVQHGQGDGGK